MREILVDLDLFLISQKRNVESRFFRGGGRNGGGGDGGGGKSWVFLGGGWTCLPFHDDDFEILLRLEKENYQPTFFFIFLGEIFTRGKTLLVGGPQKIFLNCLWSIHPISSSFSTPEVRPPLKKIKSKMSPFTRPALFRVIRTHTPTFMHAKNHQRGKRDIEALI